MKLFNQFYLWAANMKYHMAIYTIAAIFVKSIINLLTGVFSVEIITMFQMMIISLVFACAETLIFPQKKEWNVTGYRAILWAMLANILYIGSSIVFVWFPNVPMWCSILAVLIMECALFAMWYVLWLENKLKN